MAARATADVQLDAQAAATVQAFCKDEEMGLSEALSFIVNDWAALKLAALRAASFDCAPFGRSAQDACQESVKVA